jgi:hypothetical protein
VRRLAAVAQELIEQVAVGAVDLDAVEAGGLRVGAAARKPATMPGSSSSRSSRGVSYGCLPFGV